LHVVSEEPTLLMSNDPISPALVLTPPLWPLGLIKAPRPLWGGGLGPNNEPTPHPKKK